MADLSGQGIEPLKSLGLQWKTQYKKMQVYIYASSWIWNHDPKIPKVPSHYKSQAPKTAV